MRTRSKRLAAAAIGLALFEAGRAAAEGRRSCGERMEMTPTGLGGTLDGVLQPADRN